ncbi:stage V sporulation protein AD [Brevibacillus reuszeri]|uniref:SpoVAD n=1 Tax=Brevibacillus reuszeri TaxID=54915 RepID=A0A0K9YU17_9BACL|nr:stage V sporulation protein AD [Brevibacillus reuszeri]KNB72176.1 SpoVAD [Brevibacillus reuszeri]MED1855805.1 stage V sporulation protein AD [Brevibacillus reuszeri]GED72229.1 stage V sporulation protein AD [Brevibacillus reuszeri]
MRQGHQSWVFATRPVIVGRAAIGGPFEATGPLAEDFDTLHGDLMLGQESWEKAERVLMEEACTKAIEKAGVQKEKIDFLLAGDLMNQIISASFSARTLSIPFLGLFGACSTAMEGLALAALMVDSKAADYVVAATGSHNGAAEKQYRYPTEYGAQKPPTAQWTVTGAGAAVVSGQGKGLRIQAATIGHVVDMGMTDPFNMGAAMAPAALSTIESHFRDLALPHDHYDLIVTGDLGRTGHAILSELLPKHNLHVPLEKYTDCGKLIYGENPNVWSGGSGCGCVATVTYGHLLNRLQAGEWKRILVVATGALLSPISYQQGESIPCIAHAVAIESE